jgi:hypothetical protein
LHEDMGVSFFTTHSFLFESGDSIGPSIVSEKCAGLLRIWWTYCRYERIEEIVWVKTNQLQRLIRTGRTGHYLSQFLLSLLPKNPEIILT